MLGSSYWSYQYHCKIDWSVYENKKSKDYKESGVWKLGRELVVFLHIGHENDQLNIIYFI